MWLKVALHGMRLRGGAYVNTMMGHAVGQINFMYIIIIMPVQLMLQRSCGKDIDHVCMSIIEANILGICNILL